MALIKCNECGNKVSDKAESCPKCGNPINEKDYSNSTLQIAVSYKKILISIIHDIILIPTCILVLKILKGFNYISSEGIILNRIFIMEFLVGGYIVFAICMLIRNLVKPYAHFICPKCHNNQSIPLNELKYSKEEKVYINRCSKCFNEIRIDFDDKK